MNSSRVNDDDIPQKKVLVVRSSQHVTYGIYRAKSVVNWNSIFFRTFCCRPDPTQNLSVWIWKKPPALQRNSPIFPSSGGTRSRWRHAKGVTLSRHTQPSRGAVNWWSFFTQSFSGIFPPVSTGDSMMKQEMAFFWGPFLRGPMGMGHSRYDFTQIWGIWHKKLAISSARRRPELCWFTRIPNHGVLRNHQWTIGWKTLRINIFFKAIANSDIWIVLWCQPLFWILVPSKTSIPHIHKYPISLDLPKRLVR